MIGSEEEYVSTFVVTDGLVKCHAVAVGHAISSHAYRALVQHGSAPVVAF